MVVPFVKVMIFKPDAVSLTLKSAGGWAIEVGGRSTATSSPAELYLT
jgi:hypothetical protein